MRYQLDSLSLDKIIAILAILLAFIANCNFIFPLVTPELIYSLKYATGSFPEEEETLASGSKKQAQFFPILPTCSPRKTCCIRITLRTSPSFS